jgi:hypothetical protein
MLCLMYSVKGPNFWNCSVRNHWAPTCDGWTLEYRIQIEMFNRSGASEAYIQTGGIPKQPVYIPGVLKTYKSDEVTNSTPSRSQHSLMLHMWESKITRHLWNAKSHCAFHKCPLSKLSICLSVCLSLCLSSCLSAYLSTILCWILAAFSVS